MKVSTSTKSAELTTLESVILAREMVPEREPVAHGPEGPDREEPEEGRAEPAEPAEPAAEVTPAPAEPEHPEGPKAEDGNKD